MAPKQSKPSGGTVTKVVACPVDSRVPPPGSVITKDYKGTKLLVTVLVDGSEFEGERFASLSAITKKVTGQHWNGYGFFGLGKESKK